MKQSLPIWVQILLGIHDYTPRGMAKRFGKKNLAMIKISESSREDAMPKPAGEIYPTPQSGIAKSEGSQN